VAEPGQSSSPVSVCAGMSGSLVLASFGSLLLSACFIEEDSMQLDMLSS
jgi:hypothetical protein